MGGGDDDGFYQRGPAATGLQGWEPMSQATPALCAPSLHRHSIDSHRHRCRRTRSSRTEWFPPSLLSLLLVWEDWQRISGGGLRSVSARLIGHEPPWLPLATFVHGLGLLTALPMSIAEIPLPGNLEDPDSLILNDLPECLTKLTSSSYYFVAERQLRGAPVEGHAIDELESTEQRDFEKLSETHDDDSGGGDDGGGGGGGDGEPNWTDRNCSFL